MCNCHWYQRCSHSFTTLISQISLRLHARCVGEHGQDPRRSVVQFPQDLNEGEEEYGLDKTIWSAIGKACKESGNTIPSTFGCRVPNIAEERSHFIVESWSQWCMYLTPALLQKCFKHPAYYCHFTNLVTLLNKCLSCSVNFEDVEMLQHGFAERVKGTRG